VLKDERFGLNSRLCKAFKIRHTGTVTVGEIIMGRKENLIVLI
jgi:hypothetical protein